MVEDKGCCGRASGCRSGADGAGGGRVLPWFLISCLPQGCRSLWVLGPRHLPFPWHHTEGDAPPVGLPTETAVLLHGSLLWLQNPSLELYGKPELCLTVWPGFLFYVCWFWFVFFFLFVMLLLEIRRKSSQQQFYKCAAREGHGCLHMEWCCWDRLASLLRSWGVFRCNFSHNYQCNPAAFPSRPGMLTEATQAGPCLPPSPKVCCNFVCTDKLALSSYPYLKVYIDI